MHAADPPSARYLVVAADGDVTTTEAENAAREEALNVARAVRERGQRVWIMRMDGVRAQCGTRDEDARIQDAATALWIDVRTPRPRSS